MRSTLLLVSLLTFVHFISATPARRGPSGASFVPSVQVPNGPFYTWVGCRQVGALANEVPLADEITVEICIATCWSNNKNYTQGGVANTQCFCDTGTNSGRSLDHLECEQSHCAGNSKEFCGSARGLILYQSDSN